MNTPNIVVNQDTPQFQSWLAACQDGLDDHMKTNFPRLEREELVAGQGGRYIRINNVTRNPKFGQPNEQEFLRNSAWAFVDRTNGDVLKPASWRAPAKHARGNIFDESNGLAAMGPYGPAYIKGPSMGTGTFLRFKR